MRPRRRSSCFLPGCELFERLQAEHPGVYPNGQLRTLQRRLKGWRREAARRLVFATPTMEPGFGTGAEGRCYRATGEDKAPAFAGNNRRGAPCRSRMIRACARAAWETLRNDLQ